MLRRMLLKPLKDLHEVLSVNPNVNGIGIQEEGTSISLDHFNLGPLNLNQKMVIVISVHARVILQRSVEPLPT